MNTTHNDQELLIRLNALEEENARLRAESTNQKGKLIVTEGDYKGHPTLTFEGSVRRFSLGLTKLRALKEAWPHIEGFLRRNEKAAGHDEDLKI
jgi:hypothetical protein